MRIVLVVPAFPKLSETFIVSKALDLLDRGIDVQIVCSSSDEEEWRCFAHRADIERLQDRVHIRPGSLRDPRSITGLARSTASVGSTTRRRYLGRREAPASRRIRDLAVDGTILALEPDLVHFEFGTLAREFAPRRNLFEVPFTVSFRGFDLAYSGLTDPHYYDDVWVNTDAVHVLAQGQWERARHRGAPADLPHAVIHPALDVGALQPGKARPVPVGTTEAPLRLLSVGRLHWKKGYDHILDAVACLVDDGCVLEYRIIGDGDLYEALHFWRHQLGLDDVVDILGPLSPDEIPEHLRWADLFLQGSVSEGFCNAVVEAQAHGVPVVATDADGLPDNIVDGGTGVIVPRRDPVAMARAIGALAADPDLRARMGTAGIERAATVFRIEDQTDAWIEFYETTVANPRH